MNFYKCKNREPTNRFTDRLLDAALALRSRSDKIKVLYVYIPFRFMVETSFQDVDQSDHTVELIPLTGPINGESLLKYFANQRRFAVALLFWISFAVVFFSLHSKHRI